MASKEEHDADTSNADPPSVLENVIEDSSEAPADAACDLSLQCLSP